MTKCNAVRQALHYYLSEYISIVCYSLCVALLLNIVMQVFRGGSVININFVYVHSSLMKSVLSLDISLNVMEVDTLLLLILFSLDACVVQQIPAI